MKKILLPLTGDHYPQDLLDFVGRLHAQAPVLVTAAALPVSDYAGMLEAELPGAVPGTNEGDEEQRARRQCRKVERACEDMGIPCKMHLDLEDFALPCLRKESRYADLMLLDSRHFFEERDSGQPNAWMKDTLHRSECPVLLLPGKTTLPGEVILTYDGSAESVFAIKEFAHLFPEFHTVQTTLVYINDETDARIPEESSIRELGRLHFKKFRVLNLRMKSTEFFDNWVGMMTNPWLVTGSFGRSALSQLFRGSFSDALIRRHQVPVFVAHR
jgi:hypothetical protein